ncbi:LysR family transcriptional regulator [bacterium]|nr:MAG: LysR family transcriptional regulator [bacterium]
MELRQLATFRTVAKTLNVTRAAEELNYAQSSVTAQIQALEEELETPLFERLGRRIVLTGAGGRLVAYAEQLLRLAGEARSAVGRNGEGVDTLRIGAPESLCAYRLPRMLTAFRKRFPRVQLVFQPGLCPDLRRSVGSGEIDVAFLLEEHQFAGDLTIETLLREPLVLIAEPRHRLARRARISPRDLEGEPILAVEKGCTYRARFEELLAQNGVRPSSTIEFGSNEAIKQCVAAGAGIAILPEIAVRAEIAKGMLTALPLSLASLRFYTVMACHKDKWLSPPLAYLLELARETMRASVASTASR